MMTPGQAERMASVISAAISGSQPGKWPISGFCDRKCTCMMAAPASKAWRADCAISWGVTGTMGCWRGSVRMPFKAQVRIALDIGGLFQRLDLEQQGRVRGPVPFFHMNGRHLASVDRTNPHFHLHRLDNGEDLPGLDGLPGLRQNLHDNARGWSGDVLPIAALVFRPGGPALREGKDGAAGTQMKASGVPNRNRAAADAADPVDDLRPAGLDKA